jgi:hypothetical protein
MSLRNRLSWRCSWVLSGIVASSSVLVACQLKPPESILPDGSLQEIALVPQESPFIVSLATQPEAGAFTIPESLIDSWKEPLKDETDYRSQIRPWAGDQVTAAIVDLDVDPRKDELIPGILVVSTTKDTSASKTFLQSLRNNYTSAEFEERKLGDITLHVQSNGQPGQKLITAEFGKAYVAIANDPAVMERAIAVYQGKDQAQAISQDPAFKTVVTSLFKKGSLAFAYINPRFYAEWENVLTAYQSDPSLQLEMSSDEFQQAIAQLQALKGLGMVAQWNSDGFLLQSQLELDPKALLYPAIQTAARGHLIQKLPGSNVLTVMTSDNLLEYWQQTLGILESSPQSAEFLTEWRKEVKATSGLDLEQDILGWMDGEISVSLLKDPKGNPLFQGLGGMMILETSQKEKAEISLQKLEDLAKSFGLGVVKQGETVLWKGPFNQTIATRSWSGNYLVISSSTTASDLFTQNTGDFLPTVDPFADLYKTLHKPNFGYLLINAQGLMDTFGSQIPTSTMDPAMKTLLQQIGGIGHTSYALDADSYGFQLLITPRSTQ